MFHQSLRTEYEEGEREVKLKKLGRGTFGTIYYTTATPEVYKTCHAIKNYPSLVNEYRHLKAIHETLSTAGNSILSPTPLDFHCPDDDEFWNEVSLSFFPSDSERTFVFSMTRVYPMPGALKKRLIELFCPKNLVDQTTSSVPRGDHVARLLLGHVDPDIPPRYLNTYDFPLTRQRAELLGIDTVMWSTEMGRMLAQLHMTARNDARGIKVVLGADITATTYRPREPRVWVLDFDQVKDFNFAEEQITLLVDAFFTNEAYFPRARTTDPLYNAFAAAYVDECKKIGEGAATLGQQFIATLEAEQIHRDGSLV